MLQVPTGMTYLASDREALSKQSFIWGLTLD